MRNQDIIVEPIRLVDIFIDGERRPLNEAAVERLAASIESIGLRHPITIRYVEVYQHPDEGELHGAYLLVAGRHRLEAYRQLGRERIECTVVQGDAVDARLWEIAENLHRADLSELERKLQIAEWIELADGRPKLSQLATVSAGGRGKEGGVRLAARELGVDKDEAHRAVKIASISEQARQAAVEAHLDNNQAALLKIAKAEPSDQLAVVRDLVKAKETKLDTDIKNRAAEEMAEAIVRSMPASEHGMMRENAWICAKPLAIALTNLLGNSIMDRRHG